MIEQTAKLYYMLYSWEYRRLHGWLHTLYMVKSKGMGRFSCLDRLMVPRTEKQSASAFASKFMWRLTNDMLNTVVPYLGCISSCSFQLFLFLLDYHCDTVN